MKYTAEQVEFLKQHIPGRSYREIADAFNAEFDASMTPSQVKSFIANEGHNTGRTGHFPKGHVPFNKGKKRWWTGGEETRFKKGNKPYNWMPIGSEKEKSDGYIYVKVADGQLNKNWKQKHRWVYEQHHGPIPAGHQVIFGDSDSRNFDIDNLILVTRAQLAVINRLGLIKNDADLTRVGLIIADVKQKISELKRR